MVRSWLSVRQRGASAVEYIIVVLLLALTVVGGHKLFGAQVKCKVTTALNVFGGDSSAACAAAAPPPVAQNDGPITRCFVAGTPVLTEFGLLPIESLDVGVRVLARAESGGELDWKPVLHTFVSHSRSLVRLTLAGPTRVETLEVTPSHRLHVLDRGWLPAGELTPGRDRLVDDSGAPLDILQAESLPLQVPVYNLEVADYHTYFVGELNVWAHNRAPNPPPVVNDPAPPTIADPDAPIQLPVPIHVVRRRRGQRNQPPPAEPPPPTEPAPPIEMPRPPSPEPQPSGPPRPPSPSDDLPPPSGPSLIQGFHQSTEPPPSSGPSLMQGFNESSFDRRMHASGSIWSRDAADSAAAQQALDDKLARIKQALDKANQEVRNAQRAVQKAHYGSPEYTEAKLDELTARLERDKWQRAYDELQHRRASVERYRNEYGHQPPPPPDEVVGTLTIHANPTSADPARLTPQELAEGNLGHSWVSFQANPVSAPQHLTFTMWHNAQSGTPTTLGFFPVDRSLGSGRSVPGVVLIPDPASRSTNGTTQSYPLTQAQLDRLLVYADDHRNADYNVCTHNCTSWAAGAVAATGHTPPPSRWLGTSWLGVDNPNSLHNGIVGSRPPEPPPDDDDGGGCG